MKNNFEAAKATHAEELKVGLLLSFFFKMLWSYFFTKKWLTMCGIIFFKVPQGTLLTAFLSVCVCVCVCVSEMVSHAFLPSVYVCEDAELRIIISEVLHFCG